MHTVIETPAFVRSADKAGMTEDERAGAVDIVAANPEAGDLIVGSGGCRKVRVAGRGHGKSGGYRVITYFTGRDGRVFLLWAISKGRDANLTDRQVNDIAKFVKTLAEMELTDMDESDFNGIMEGLGEAAAFMRGEDVPGIRVHVPADSDVRAIRGRLGLSRADFAKRFSLPLGTVRDWEQGRRAPDTASRNLLKIIDREPEAAARALEGV